MAHGLKGGRPVAVSALFCLASSASLLAGPVVTSADVKAFLGGRTGKMVYTVWEGDNGIKNGRKLCYVDFSEDPMVERILVQYSNTEPRNAVISPDGNWVAYNTTDGLPDNAYNSQLYVCALRQAAQGLHVGPGAQPHWWVKPGTSTAYVVYPSCDIEECWQMCMPSEHVRWGAACNGTAPSYGNTLISQIANGAPSGGPKTLLDYYTNGGRSRQGGFLFTSSRATGTFGIDRTAVSLTSPSAIHRFATQDDGCNPSISPHQLDADVQVLWLNQPHDSLFVGTPSGTITRMIGINDAGNKYWDTPEWSTDVGYAVAVASPADVQPPFDVYLVNLKDGQYLRVLDGNYQYPHLWVGPGQSAIRLPCVAPETPRSIRVDMGEGALRITGVGLAGCFVVVHDLRGRALISSRLAGDVAVYSATNIPGAAVVSIRGVSGNLVHTFRATGRQG